MKLYIAALLGVLLWTGGCAPVVVGPPPPPPGVVVAVEDRPYYVHGPYYVVQGRRWVWVAGHWRIVHHHRVWIHGRYVIS